MRILLLSAYDSASHRYWREGLVEALSAHQWTVLALPGRYFSWRIRGNPLSWLETDADTLRQPYDLLIVTSMVDVATLKGLFPSLAPVPTLCYFHENQFEYPPSEQQQGMLEAQMVNLYSALASDRLLFNSAFNRDSFFAGVDRLMKRLPDLKPGSLSHTLAVRSAVLPVPLRGMQAESAMNRSDRPRNDVFTLVWNHRWEYDKGPDRLLLMLRRLKAMQIDFRLHLLGERFRSCPDALNRIGSEFAEQLDSFGYQPDRSSYYRILAAADLVLSTSIHEFQGLAVMEAVALGAVPAVPDRLSYCELFGSEFRYPSSVSDAEKESLAAARHVQQCYRLWQSAELAAPALADNGFWETAAAGYEREIAATLQASGRGKSAAG